MALCRAGFVFCRGFHPASLELCHHFCNHSRRVFFVLACCVKICLVLPVISNFGPVGYEGYVKQHIPSKYCHAWGGFDDCVIGGVNGPCHLVKEDINVIGGYWAMSISAVHSICHKTWCACSNIAFACGFLIRVGLCLIPYESHRYLKFNLNSLPLSYTKYQRLGYLLNQNLLANSAMQYELLLKISLHASNSLPSAVIVLSHWTRGNSTISNQLDARSIMVRAMKSITEPSLPLRVYGPKKSTHIVLHGVVIMVIGGRCP